MKSLIAGAALVLAAILPASAQQCEPVANIMAEAGRIGAVVSVHQGQPLAKAKRFYAELPPEGEEPDADHVLLVEFLQGPGMLIFTRGDMACWQIRAPSSAELRSLLLGNPA